MLTQAAIIFPDGTAPTGDEDHGDFPIYGPFPIPLFFFPSLKGCQEKAEICPLDISGPPGLREEHPSHAQNSGNEGRAEEGPGLAIWRRVKQ